MVDLSEQENRLWGRERGDRANTEYILNGAGGSIDTPKKTCKTRGGHSAFESV